MQELNFKCNNQVLLLECPDRLVVADSRKQVYANFSLDDEWNGLTVVAIFSNAWETIRKEVLFTEMCVEIPTSVLADPGFRVSLNGIGDGGNVLLSTKYMTKPISVHRAGSLVCLQAPDEDPELWQQALAAIGPLSDLDTEDKSSLVAAINEALKSGGGTITKDAITYALGYIPMGPDMVQDVVNNAAKQKVSLPGDGMTFDYGEKGQLAVSDGEGGVRWENQRQQPVSTNFYTADRDELEATFGTQDITLSDTYFDEGATRVLDIPLNEVNAEYIYNLYDELLGIEKENRTPVKDADGNPILGDDGEPVAYEYVISTGEYNTAGERGDRDTDIKKPKYLVLNCIHGNEKAAALSAYWFFKDVVERKNVPSQFREGAEFHIIPVGNKAGANKNKRYNGTKTGVTYNGVEIGVDLNRNFDYEWSSEVVRDRYPGKYAGSEIETQAIMSWLKANSDAELFIDFHNSSSDGRDENDKTIWVINEVAMVVGLNTEKMKEVKRTALRGLDRVIPFWRYDRQYTEHNLTHPPGNKNEPWGDPNMKAPVFSYSSFYEIPGASVYYATDKLDIPSITLECSILQNADLSDMRTKYPFTPETIAAGAEALGNILLEFYERSGGENHGKEGQFAVADGNGGVKWENQEKIFNDFLISLMSTPYAKYSTIENALAETNATADGKIGAYTDKHGVYQIVLLDEISSTVPIAVTRDCNIQLNGHTISFTASGAYLEVKTASAVSIDGTVAGSKIQTSNITSSVDEQVIRSTGTHLTITGGTYALENVSCKNGRVIRSGNYETQIDMNGCTVKSAGTGTNVIYGGTMAKGVLSDCTVKVEAENASAQGITVFTDVTMSNCTFDVKATGQGYSAMAVMAINNATININSCNITADGYGDVMVNGKTEGRFVAAVHGGSATTVNINGGHYKAAREAIVISGAARIDGGVFEGCQHGGAYLNGVDTKVKNATFRNIAYFGDCGWNDNRFGACYCGDGTGVNATFYKCNFGTDGTSADYGVRTKGTNCNTYISDSKINGNFTYDLSVDAGNNIYIGKNVTYRQDKVQGSIDTTTYAGQSFAW